MNQDSHVIKKIWQNIDSFTLKERKHIEQCEICQREYKIHKKIIESIQSLPEIEVYPNIQELVYFITIKPFFSLWRLILICSMMMSLPFIVQFDIFIIYLNRNIVNVLILLSVFLYMIFIIMLSYYLFFKYFKKIVKFSEKIDIFLEKKLMKIQK